MCDLLTDNSSFILQKLAKAKKYMVTSLKSPNEQLSTAKERKKIFI